MSGMPSPRSPASSCARRYDASTGDRLLKLLTLHEVVLEFVLHLLQQQQVDLGLVAGIAQFGLKAVDLGLWVLTTVARSAATALSAYPRTGTEPHHRAAAVDRSDQGLKTARRPIRQIQKPLKGIGLRRQGLKMSDQ
jgi:hypothetical protein